jgi:hypothetical protein
LSRMVTVKLKRCTSMTLNGRDEKGVSSQRESRAVISVTGRPFSWRWVSRSEDTALTILSAERDPRRMRPSMTLGRMSGSFRRQIAPGSKSCGVGD